MNAPRFTILALKLRHYVEQENERALREVGVVGPVRHVYRENPFEILSFGDVLTESVKGRHE